jgi:hypothetical protein
LNAREKAFRPQGNFAFLKDPVASLSLSVAEEVTGF